MDQSYIRVYLTKEPIQWIIGRSGWRIKKIKKDTHTKIDLNKHDYNSYFFIEGSLEDVHRARIILQDLEKEYYKNEHINKIKQDEESMKEIINRLRGHVSNFDNNYN